jgi:hypothetical protein
MRKFIRRRVLRRRIEEIKLASEPFALALVPKGVRWSWLLSLERLGRALLAPLVYLDYFGRSRQSLAPAMGSA